MKSFYIIFLLLFCGNSICSQQIHTITGWKKILDADDTTAKKIIVIVYNDKGNLVAEHNMEGMSFDTLAYDASGRVIYTNYIGGETDWRCNYSYLKNKKISDCHSISDYQELDIDSLDDKGRIIASFHESYQNYHSDKEPYIKNNSLFIYDDKKNEIVQKDMDSDGKVGARWIRKKFTASGKIESVVSYYGSENKRGDDSTIYEYDEKNRLTKVRNYEYMQADGTVLLYKEVKIDYFNASNEVLTNRLNDTIIHENLPYESYQFDLVPDYSPSTITFISEENEKGIKKVINDVSYYYSYDSEGRLVSIGGSGKTERNENVSKDVTISYSENNYAVENHYGQNYMGSRVSGFTREYKNGLLVKQSYNSEHGFPFETTYYIYTFYK